jgi:hypothetical protein
MIDFTKAKLTRLSRRALLQELAAVTGGTALFATLGRSKPAAAQAKTSQKAVAYQPTPHGAQQCDNCRQFVAPSACKVVDGDVSPAGWCKVYVKMPPHA